MWSASPQVRMSDREKWGGEKANSTDGVIGVQTCLGLQQSPVSAHRKMTDRSAPSVRVEWMEPTASAPAVTHQKGQQSTIFNINYHLIAQYYVLYNVDL